jgi:hypothetical protein
MNIEYSEGVCNTKYSIIEEEVSWKVLSVVAYQIVAEGATTVEEHRCN